MSESIIDAPEGIAFYQLCARRGALRLELRGLRRRGRSAYAICKEVYGLKGNRERVLAQMDALIEKAQEENRERAARAARARGPNGLRPCEFYARCGQLARRGFLTCAHCQMDLRARDREEPT